MQIEPKFDINQKVLIEPLESYAGKVVEIICDREGICYKVRYFYNAEEHRCCFDECELSKVKEK